MNPLLAPLLIASLVVLLFVFLGLDYRQRSAKPTQLANREIPAKPGVPRRRKDGGSRNTPQIPYFSEDDSDGS